MIKFFPVDIGSVDLDGPPRRPGALIDASTVIDKFGGTSDAGGAFGAVDVRCGDDPCARVTGAVLPVTVDVVAIEWSGSRAAVSRAIG